MKNNVIPALCSLLMLASCASLKPERFSSSTPLLNPVTFFGGHTRSTGVLEARSGKPSERITTQTAGVFANGISSTWSRTCSPKTASPATALST